MRVYMIIEYMRVYVPIGYMREYVPIGTHVTVKGERERKRGGELCI